MYESTPLLAVQLSLWTNFYIPWYCRYTVKVRYIGIRCIGNSFKSEEFNDTLDFNMDVSENSINSYIGINFKILDSIPIYWNKLYAGE